MKILNIDDKMFFVRVDLAKSCDDIFQILTKKYHQYKYPIPHPMVRDGIVLFSIPLRARRYDAFRHL